MNLKALRVLVLAQEGSKIKTRKNQTRKVQEHLNSTAAVGDLKEGAPTIKAAAVEIRSIKEVAELRNTDLLELNTGARLDQSLPIGWMKLLNLFNQCQSTRTGQSQ